MKLLIKSHIAQLTHFLLCWFHVLSQPKTGTDKGRLKPQRRGGDGTCSGGPMVAMTPGSFIAYHWTLSPSTFPCTWIIVALLSVLYSSTSLPPSFPSSCSSCLFSPFPLPPLLQSFPFFFFFFFSFSPPSLVIAPVPRNVSDPSVIAKGTLGIREFPSSPVCVCVCVCVCVKLCASVRVVNRYCLMDSSQGCCPSAWPMKCSQLLCRPRWQPIKWKWESLEMTMGFRAEHLYCTLLM